MSVKNRTGLRMMVAVFVLAVGARVSLAQTESTEPAKDQAAEEKAAASAEQDLAVDQARLADLRWGRRRRLLPCARRR